MNDFTHFTDTENNFLYPSLHNGRDSVCVYSLLTKLSDSRSEASSKHSICCLTPADSSLNSSPNVLFLFIAFHFISLMDILAKMASFVKQKTLYSSVPLHIFLQGIRCSTPTEDYIRRRHRLHPEAHRQNKDPEPVWTP